MTKNAQSIHALFRRKYLVGLVLIAGLVSSSLFVFFDQTSQHTGRAALINLASTQKALSQRIAFFSNALTATADDLQKAPLRTELRSAIAEMRHAHVLLSGKGQTSKSTQRHLRSIEDIYFNAYSPFDADVQAFLTSAERLLSDDYETESEKQSIISEINLLGTHTIMQTHYVITRILTYDAEQAIVRTRAIQFTLMAMIVLLLIAESIFIFEPMGQRIQESIRRAELSEQNAMNQATRATHAHNAKVNFLRIMSHELRTPLNAVIGITKLLSETTLNPQQTAYAKHISDAGRHMLAVADDILTINQHDAGKMRFSYSSANLKDELSGVVELLTQRANEKDLVLELDFPDSPNGDGALNENFEIDVQRFRQVLFNLIGNAIKFTDEGSICLSARVTEDKDQDHRDIEVRVRDTGQGIAPEKQEKIFEEFEQAHALGKRSYGGAGLGLAISRKIIEGLGGVLLLESSTPEGSTFLIRLRLKKTALAAQETRVSEQQTPPARDNLTVLVVDDNLPNRMIAGAFLKKSGFNVIFAENGRQAVNIFAAKDHIDLVFMDIEMPVLDGVSATKELRENHMRDHKTPIVAVTAHALPEDREHLLAQGFDEVLRKPTMEADLVDCSRRFLRLQNAA